jgi:TonB family protein
MRASGLVKIEVVVDESGEVAEVKNAAGNALLVPAAKDAIRKWKFRPLMRDGQAVRASGFVNFNFTLLTTEVSHRDHRVHRDYLGYYLCALCVSWLNFCRGGSLGGNLFNGFAA